MGGVLVATVTPATVLRFAAIVVVVAAALASPWGRRLLRPLRRPVGAVAFGIAAALIDLVIAPIARLVGRWTGRRPSSWRPIDPSTSWRPVGPDLAADRPYGAAIAATVPDRPSRRRARTRAIVGLAVAVVAVDLLAGAVWSRDQTFADRSGTVVGLPVAGPTLPPGTVPPYVDDRWRSPAFAASPWAEDYFRELREQGTEAVPFLNVRYRDRTGEHLNVRDHVRASSDAGRGPVVWFFGGSTIFGEGQRDAHTIPSEVARLAEAAGRPVQVVNFGVQADSNFQSVLRLEDALATVRPLPDLVVLYDGANDITQHATQPPTDQPSIYQGIGGPSSPDAEEDLRDAWQRTSVLRRALDRDAAQPGDLPAPPEQLAAHAIGVYRRGLRLAEHLATESGAAFASYFQPAAIYADLPFSDLVRADLPTGTIDLSHVLDGPEGQATYFDPVHTNERGAQLVAEAMLPTLLPLLDEAAS